MKNLQKLIELIQQNPDLRVVPMVNYDIVAEDSYSYWTASFGKCEVTEIHADDERVYFDDDFDDLVDKFINDYDGFKKYTDEELEKIAEEVVKNYNWEKVIVVYIELPEVIS